MRTAITTAKLMISALIIFSAQGLFAQDKAKTDEQDKKYRLHIIKDENGNQEIIDKTFTTKEEMDAYIKDNKIEEDMPEIIEVEAPTAPTPPTPPTAPTAPTKCTKGKDCSKECEKKCTKKIVIIENEEGNNSGKTKLEITTEALNGEEQAKLVQQLINSKLGEVHMINIKKEIKTKDSNSEATTPGPVKAETLANSSESVSDINIFPNPNNGQFHIQFNVGKPTNIKLRITDLDGKEVYAEALNNYSGKFDKEIDRSSVSKGTYLMAIEAGGETKTTTVVMQ